HSLYCLRAPSRAAAQQSLGLLSSSRAATEPRFTSFHLCQRTRPSTKHSPTYQQTRCQQSLLPEAASFCTRGGQQQASDLDQHGGTPGETAETRRQLKQLREHHKPLGDGLDRSAVDRLPLLVPHRGHTPRDRQARPFPVPGAELRDRRPLRRRRPKAARRRAEGSRVAPTERSRGGADGLHPAAVRRGEAGRGLVVLEGHSAGQGIRESVGGQRPQGAGGGETAVRHL
ncbi:unnamed protein product, partial [Ectocarpus fasciculatus]